MLCYTYEVTHPFQVVIKSIWSFVNIDEYVTNILYWRILIFHYNLQLTADFFICAILVLILNINEVKTRDFYVNQLKLNS